MFELSVKTHFSAAHRLVNYPGACANLHGHNWDVEIFVRGSELDEIGILADFKELKKAISDIVDECDHVELNSLDEFKDKNPTSENIARYFYKFLSQKLNCDRYQIYKVSIYETPGSCASYWE